MLWSASFFAAATERLLGVSRGFLAGAAAEEDAESPAAAAALRLRPVTGVGAPAGAVSGYRNAEAKKGDRK
jgi:hypothetical protein